MKFFFKKSEALRANAPLAKTTTAPILNPTTPCRPAESHPYQIFDFFVFRRTLFGRGTVEHAKEDRPQLSLLLPGNVWLAAPYDPDPFNPDLEERTAFNFAVTLPCRPTGIDASLIALFVHFKTEHLNISNPTWERLQHDKFVSSETPFKQAIDTTPNGRVLEIGSRARSGITRRELFPETMEYIGFDIAPGPNVNVIGDAHELSSYFPAEHFDLAFSISVWEHLAMPWKVSIELNKVLKTGGIAMINTHQSWPSHEEPWDYFRFSEYSWNALFNSATGFEILASGMGFPAVMASALAIPHLHEGNLEWHYGYLASRCVVKKIGPTTLDWPVGTALVARGQYSY